MIGNGNYPDDNEPPNQPAKDARAFAQGLRETGFDVEFGENLTRSAMRTAIENFKVKIKPGSSALFFFSGYGVQALKQSYILPVDARIWSEADVRRDGIGLESILTEMNNQSGGVKLAVIDASRRNPFERRFRSFSAGLAPVNMPRNTLVAYAAVPGETVRDSDGEHSLFVEELLKEMRSTGATAQEVFTRTQVGVYRGSNGEQVPWIASSLAEAFYFGRVSAAGNSSQGATTSSRTPETSDAEAAAERDCDSAKQAGMKQAWENFLARHPVGACADLARQRVAKLDNGDDDTLRKFDEELQRNPNNGNAYYKRGQLYAKRGEHNRAIQDFDRALRLNPRDAEALNNRCWLRAVVGELRGALADCNEALMLQPNYADALDSRGFTRLKMKDGRRAVADYDAALRGNPEQASSLFGRGKAKLKNGDVAGGNADIEAAQAIRPDIAKEFEGYGIR